MKQSIEIEIPDGFEALKDQSTPTYLGQSFVHIKLTPISEEAKHIDDMNRQRVAEMFAANNNKTK